MVTKYVDSGNGSPSAPYESLATAATTLETIDALGLSAGDIVLVRDDHSENDAGTEIYTFADGVEIISIDASENYSPMSSSTGMIITSGSADDIQFDKGIWKGLSFKSGDLFYFTDNANTNILFIDCVFELNAASNNMKADNNSCVVTFVNCTLTWNAAHTGDGFSSVSDGTKFYFYGCTFNGTLTVNLNSSVNSNFFQFIGCDFSNFGATASFFEWSDAYATNEAVLKFAFCTIPDITYTRPAIGNAVNIELVACDDGDTWITEKQTDGAYLITNSAVYKTGGFELPDPNTSDSSWQIVSNDDLAQTNNTIIFTTPMIWTWNDDTTNKNASVEVLLTDSVSVTTPTTADMGIWMFALGSASTPLWSCYEDMFPAVGDTGDGTGTSYSESGTNGDGWTGGGSTKKAFTVTLPSTQTIGRKGQVGVIFWCRNLASNDALYLNPQVTLST